MIQFNWLFALASICLLTTSCALTKVSAPRPYSPLVPQAVHDPMIRNSIKKVLMLALMICLPI